MNQWSSLIRETSTFFHSMGWPYSSFRETGQRRGRCCRCCMAVYGCRYRGYQHHRNRKNSQPVPGHIVQFQVRVKWWWEEITFAYWSIKFHVNNLWCVYVLFIIPTISGGQWQSIDFIHEFVNLKKKKNRILFLMNEIWKWMSNGINGRGDGEMEPNAKWKKESW